MTNINPQDFITLAILFSLAVVVLGIIMIFIVAGNNKEK